MKAETGRKKRKCQVKHCGHPKNVKAGLPKYKMVRKGFLKEV